MKKVDKKTKKEIERSVTEGWNNLYLRLTLSLDDDIENLIDFYDHLKIKEKEDKTE